MGGDHSVTYPILKQFCEKPGPTSTVHFYAQSHSWREDEDRTDHGTMFFHAARLGLVAPHHSVQIGLPTWNPESLGVNFMDADFVRRSGHRTDTFDCR